MGRKMAKEGIFGEENRKKMGRKSGGNIDRTDGLGYNISIDCRTRGETSNVGRKGENTHARNERIHHR